MQWSSSACIVCLFFFLSWQIIDALTAHEQQIEAEPGRQMKRSSITNEKKSSPGRFGLCKAKVEVPLKTHLPPDPRGRQKPRSDGSIHIAFKFWLKTTRNRCFGSWRFTAGFKFSPLPIFKESGRENVISGGRLSLAVQLFHNAKRTQLARHDAYFSPKDRCKNRDRFCP